MIKLVTIKQAADLLGVTTKTLRNGDAAGKLCPIRTLGGHRRYSILDIEDVNYPSHKGRGFQTNLTAH